jgi:hypothetical protein
MKINRKSLAILCLSSLVIFFAGTSSSSSAPDREYKNLKVLPKNISHEELGKVMGSWATALGVRCSFCHLRDSVAKKIDFVSDAKPEKEMARHMFMMTSKINKKFFKAEKDSSGMITESSVSCITCHHGTAHPETAMPAPEAKK